MIIISPSAKVSPLADIEDSVRGTRITIEADVMIDAFVKIKPAGGADPGWSFTLVGYQTYAADL